MISPEHQTRLLHKLYIETVGCQMNMLDSEMVVASLRRQGYELTQSVADADTILFNTCSVREQAENKTYSALGRLRDEKKRNPHKIIGVMGCMAQKDQHQIFKRAPFVDIIAGPGQLQQIPELIAKARAEGGQHAALSMARTGGPVEQIKRSHETFDPLRDPTMRPTPFQAFLRIQIGCDKFCTYCIVPMTRGPEQGRNPNQIIEEAELLARQGAREITLLGQTVNSYKFTSRDGRITRLADLLTRLQEIEGLDRIKFVTNYPKDMTRELLQAVRDLSKISPYLHVPLQSGSDAVLKRMKRGYSVGDYREMMGRIDEILGDTAAISSDFIVGFCGETDTEFQQSVQLVEECRFKNSFIFKYSQRPGTKAATNLTDDIPFEVKRRRNNELLAVQNRISEEDNQRFLGQVVEVLVEGASKRSDAPANLNRQRNNDANTATEPSNSPTALTQPASGEIDFDFASESGINQRFSSIKIGVHEDHSGSDGVRQLTGRTHCDRIVVFDGTDRLIGQLVKIGVYDAGPFTLMGTVLTSSSVPQLVSLATPAGVKASHR